MINRILDQGYYIRIYNKLIDDNSKHRVTPDALYVYSILFINRRQDESMLTSIAMVEATMSDNARFSNRKQTNRKKIHEALIELVDKDVLILTSHKPIENIKINDFITLRINEKALNRHPEKETFNGYEELYIEEFMMFLNSFELFIYIIAKRFTGNGGFQSSYDRWAKLLGVSRNTALKILEETKKRNLITIKVGNYVSKNRQQINTYYYVNQMYEDDETEIHSVQQEESQEKQIKQKSPPEKKKAVIAFSTQREEVTHPF